MASASALYEKAYEQHEAEGSTATGRAADLAPTIAIPQPEDKDDEETEKRTGAANTEAAPGAMGVVTSADGDVEDEWHGWRSAVDELSGATYYYNVRLGRSSWDWPPAEGLED